MSSESKNQFESTKPARRAISTRPRQRMAGRRSTHSSTPSMIERIPTRWLLTGSALLCVLLWAAPSWAQSSADPVAGQLLYTDTPNQGVPTSVTNSCTNCHGAVQNRRKAIGGSDFADISFDTALNHFGQAIGSRAPMAQYKVLSESQVADIAAYIADTPKLRSAELSDTNTLAFSATAVGSAVTKTLSIKHSVATTDNLQITKIDLGTGTGTTQFTSTGGCLTTLAPAGECSFSVTFTPTTASAESRSLTVSLKQGTVTFNRVVTLNGSVSSTTLPPTTPTPTPTPLPTGGSGNDDSGGGALGWAWLAALAAASALLVAKGKRS